MTRAEITVMIRDSVQVVHESFRRTRHWRSSLIEQRRRDVGGEIETGEGILDLSFHLSLNNRRQSRSDDRWKGEGLTLSEKGPLKEKRLR